MSAGDVSAALMILAHALSDATLVFGLRRGCNRRSDRAPWACLRCYTTSAPVDRKRGSVAVAVAVLLASVAAAYAGMLACFPPHVRIWKSVVVALALTALQPFLAYELWRVKGRVGACPACGRRDLIPGDTPRAQSLRLGAWMNRRLDTGSSGSNK